MDEQQRQEVSTLIAEDRARALRDDVDESDRQQHPAWWGLALWAALIVAAIFWPKGRLLLIAIGLLAISCIVYTCAAIVWARVRGVHIHHVGIFFGPWIARFRILGLPLRINVLPMGAYVKFPSPDHAPPDSAAARSHLVPHEQTYEAQPRLQKILINLVTPLTTLALAVILLGPSAATDSFLRGFEQFTLGAFRPREYRVDAFARLFAHLEMHRYAAVLGIIAAKTAAYLLPIPNVNGGTALLELFGGTTAMRPRNVAILQFVGLLAILVLGGIWLFALGVYLLR
jgi:hypothetical protein